MSYAEVSVNSPAAQRRTFSYSIPPGMAVMPGQAVLVPFGNRVLQGIVLALADHAEVEETRDIAGVLDSRPMLSPSRIAVARWISEHYLAPLYEAVSLMLPAGFERRTVTFLDACDPSCDVSSLPQRQRQAMELVLRVDASLHSLETAMGKSAGPAVSKLVEKGLVSRRYELDKSRVSRQTETLLHLALPASEVREEAARLLRRAPRQAELLDYLAKHPGPVPAADARRDLGTDSSVVAALVKKGLLNTEQVEVRRVPFAHQGITATKPLSATAAQSLALDEVRSALATPAGIGPTRVFVLHGVTGSGKTEVYLQALAETIRRGKRGIVLVPEIALTPQTVERFAARFDNRVAVLHSQLSIGERFDEWQSIRDGEFDVVIGPRSAVFAPQPDLGLIVIDEEHEWTYKQQDPTPRYHAREVAIKLAEETGAVVILGSATPDVETYYRAQREEFRLLAMPERIVPGGKPEMPSVEIVDLREELKSGNRGVFSRALTAAIESVLSRNEQVILFLNRRGTATSIVCRSCGYVVPCPNCDVPLSYHADEDRVLCHQCDYRIRVPEECPGCGSRRIKFLGIGTQKLEHETRRSFPTARVLRWDSDVTRRKHSHQEILDSFRNHEKDILIGTQMVAKGLDLPRVTLVGVVIADIGLNLPDFRAGERTFQQLCQVAGRAGRSVLGGRVIVQTYSPEHYAVEAAAGHDYARFYGDEIAYRRLLRDPPLTRMLRMTYTGDDDARCRQEAERMARAITEERDAGGVPGLELIGPAPAFRHRLRGHYRWQLILRGADPSVVLRQLTVPQHWAIDVDPVGL